MEKFAKIFEVDGEQVLFYVEPDTQSEYDDRDRIHQIVRIDGVCADIALGGMTYEDADKAFAKFDQDYARTILKSVRDLLKKK